MLPLLVFCLVNLAVAQVPRPCTSPPQWEARIYSRSEQRELTVNARLSYDSVYQRVRVLQDMQIGDVNTQNDIIRLFQSKIEFSVDTKTGNCSRIPLARPWRDIGVLLDAQSLGETYIGSSAFPCSGIRVTLWTGNETFSQNRTVIYQRSWTHEGCIPVFDTSIDSKFGMSRSAH